jgi:hypothetical protein
MTAESKQRAIELLHRGIEMAREQGRPWWIVGMLETAIKALEQDEYEELAIRLLAIGYGWKETEHPTLAEQVAELRKRLADQLREQRRAAGKKKAGCTRADPAVVRARIEELQAQNPRIQEQAIDEIIAKEFRVKGRTRREYRKKFWQ